jgi:hypothetical protein
MPVATATSGVRPKLHYSEILSFAYDTFCSNKVRFLLTGLGMVIGTASLILVVTIGLTGKQYVLNLIQGIGANLIYAEYEGGSQRITNTAPDYLTAEDMTAVLEQCWDAASPVVMLNERVPVGDGKERDIRPWAPFRIPMFESGRFPADSSTSRTKGPQQSWTDYREDGSGNPVAPPNGAAVGKQSLRAPPYRDWHLSRGVNTSVNRK